MDPQILRQHLSYNRWATNRVIQACDGLTADKLTYDFGTADKSIAGTMLHLFRSERIWLQRIQQQSKPYIVTSDSWEFAQAAWPQLHENWEAWGQQVSPEDLDKMLHYSDLKGAPRANKVWETILHVVNHGTHHRGQVSGFLRALGPTPPSLDYIAFVRDHQAAVAG